MLRRACGALPDRSSRSRARNGPAARFTGWSGWSRPSHAQAMGRTDAAPQPGQMPDIRPADGKVSATIADPACRSSQDQGLAAGRKMRPGGDGCPAVRTASGGSRAGSKGRIRGAGTGTGWTRAGSRRRPAARRRRAPWRRCPWARGATGWPWLSVPSVKGPSPVQMTTVIASPVRADITPGGSSARTASTRPKVVPVCLPRGATPSPAVPPDGSAGPRRPANAGGAGRSQVAVAAEELPCQAGGVGAERVSEAARGRAAGPGMAQLAD